MSDMLVAVERALAANGWRATAVPNAPAFAMRFNGENGTYDCLAVVDVATGVLLCTAAIARTVPPDKYPTMLQFLNLANLALDVGSVEMLPDFGLIRARTAIDMGQSTMEDAQICQAMKRAAAAIDHYAPGLAAICNTAIGAPAAMALVEHRAESATLHPPA